MYIKQFLLVACLLFSTLQAMVNQEQDIIQLAKCLPLEVRAHIALYTQINSTNLWSIINILKKTNALTPALLDKCAEALCDALTKLNSTNLHYLLKLLEQEISQDSSLQSSILYTITQSYIKRAYPFSDRMRIPITSTSVYPTMTLVFNPQKNELCALNSSGQLSFFDAEYKQIDQLETGIINGIMTYNSQGNKLLLQSGTFNDVKVLDLTTKVLTPLSAPMRVKLIASNHSGSAVACYSKYNTLRIINLAATTQFSDINSDTLIKAGITNVISMSFTSDNTLLLCNREELDEEEAVGPVTLHSFATTSSEFTKENLDLNTLGPVKKCVFNPSGTYMLTVHTNNCVGVWNLQKHELMYDLTLHKGQVYYPIVSNDGKQCAFIRNGKHSSYIQAIDRETSSIKTIKANARTLSFNNIATDIAANNFSDRTFSVCSSILYPYPKEIILLLTLSNLPQELPREHKKQEIIRRYLHSTVVHLDKLKGINNSISNHHSLQYYLDILYNAVEELKEVPLEIKQELLGKILAYQELLHPYWQISKKPRLKY